jgi:predicted nucleotidyltransferase
LVSELTLNKISSILKDEGCKEVYLFGSHVTGHANEFSDIDIGIRGLAPSKFFAVYARLESEIPEKIDTVEYGPIFNKKFTDPFNEFASKTNIQNLMEEWSGINYDAQTVDKNLNGNNGTIRAVAYLGNRPYAYKDEKGEPTGS